MIGQVITHYRILEKLVKAFSETDFTEDLKRFDVPTLVLHGDDDQIVPIGATSLISAKIIKGATLKVFPGAPHGMCSALKGQVNAQLLAFFKGVAAASLETGVPMAFGVLTTDSIEQAIERAGSKGGNKGFDAACSAIEMVNLFRELK